MKKQQDALPDVIRESFLIDLKGTKNHTWQGNITWIAKEETVSFRSALEMIQLIRTAVEENEVFSSWEEADEEMHK